MAVSGDQHRTNDMTKDKKQNPIAALKAALVYEFKDLELLRVALTHASALDPADTVAGSYQRLEFLGDRVLGVGGRLHASPPFPKGR